MKCHLTRLGLALGAVLLCIGAAAPSCDADPDPYVLVGDDATLAAAATFGSNWTIDALPVRTMNGQAANVGTLAAGRDSIVVALGRWDARENRPAAEVHEIIADVRQAALDAPGTVCPLWVNVRSSPTTVDGQNYVDGVAVWNAELASIVAHLADWNGYSAAHPEWFAADGVTPNATGAVKYGAFIRTQRTAYC